MKTIIEEHVRRCLSEDGRINVGRLRRDADGVYTATVTVTTLTEVITFTALAQGSPDGSAVGMHEDRRVPLRELPLFA